jgi:hypothetical protein
MEQRAADSQDTVDPLDTVDSLVTRDLPGTLVFQEREAFRGL